jgi:hypothetical protein
MRGAIAELKKSGIVVQSDDFFKLGIAYYQMKLGVSMDDFLAVVAIFIFCISGYLVFDLFYTGFSWAVLLSAIGGFSLVHAIWPKKHDEDSAWYDALEYIFYFSYRFTVACIRGIVKGGDTVGFDL